MNTRHRAFRVLLTPFLVFTGCAAVQTQPDLGDCDYMGFYVDYDMNARPGSPDDSERVRTETLRIAASMLPRYGFHIAETASVASWKLTSKVSRRFAGDSFTVWISLTPSERQLNHFFVAETSGYPLPPRSMTGMGVPFREIRTTPSTSRVKAAVALIARFEKERVAPLCAASATLKMEGWSDIEDVKAQMIRDVQRLKKERSESTREGNAGVEGQE